jgi:hypothetical protein
MSEWQPIETMPRDGRMVIVYRPLAHMTHDPHVTIARTKAHSSHCWDATVPPGADGRNYTDRCCYATHWMPLPPPPTQENAG